MNARYSPHGNIHLSKEWVNLLLMHTTVQKIVGINTKIMRKASLTYVGSLLIFTPHTLCGIGMLCASSRCFIVSSAALSSMQCMPTASMVCSQLSSSWSVSSMSYPVPKKRVLICALRTSCGVISMYFPFIEWGHDAAWRVWVHGASPIHHALCARAKSRTSRL